MRCPSIFCTTYDQNILQETILFRCLVRGKGLQPEEDGLMKSCNRWCYLSMKDIPYEQQVNSSTFHSQDLVNRRFKGISGDPLLGRKTVFSEKQEAALSERIKLTDNLSLWSIITANPQSRFCICRKQITFPNYFQKKSWMVVSDFGVWLYAFLKRNPLIVRNSEQLISTY